MVDAGGTDTLITIGNVGEDTLYEIRNTSVDNGQTIPVDGVSNTPFVAEDKVMVVGVFNETQGTSLGGGTTSVEWDESALHFTVTDASASSSDIRIWFYRLGQ